MMLASIPPSLDRSGDGGSIAAGGEPVNVLLSTVAWHATYAAAAHWRENIDVNGNVSLY